MPQTIGEYKKQTKVLEEEFNALLLNKELEEVELVVSIMNLFDFIESRYNTLYILSDLTDDQFMPESATTIIIPSFEIK